jgi:hypothetical protein
MERDIENLKVIFGRLLDCLEDGRARIAELFYDELSEHEGELPEYEYRVRVDFVTSERFALRLPGVP